MSTLCVAMSVIAIIVLLVILVLVGVFILACIGAGIEERDSYAVRE